QAWERGRLRDGADMGLPRAASAGLRDAALLHGRSVPPGEGLDREGKHRHPGAPGHPAQFSRAPERPQALAAVLATRVVAPVPARVVRGPAELCLGRSGATGLRAVPAPAWRQRLSLRLRAGRHALHPERLVAPHPPARRLRVDELLVGGEAGSRGLAGLRDLQARAEHPAGRVGLSRGPGSDRGASRRRARLQDLAVALAVVVVAAAYFTQGIALSGGWEQGWIDEGILVYQSWRVAEGALPYRDVHHVYGPSAFFLPAAALQLLGPDLRSVRLSVVAVKVLIALAVYVLARRVAGVLVAGAAAGLFIAVWGEPVWVFGTAYAGHAAMACALWGLVLFIALPERPSVGAFLAGLCVGAAATFKLGAGLFPFLALVLFLIDERAGEAPTTVRWSAAAGVRLAALAGTLGLTVLYTIAGAVTDVRGLMSTVGVLAPFAACTIAVGAREVAYGVEAPARRRGPARVILAGLGAALPLAGYVAFFTAHGAAASLVHDLIALPQRL